MKTYIRKALSAAVIGATALSLPACDSFLEVENPNNLETDAVDPERDASLLSQSVYTRFVQNLEEGYVLGAWFTNHARVGDTFPTRNDVGRRDIPNATNETDAVWSSNHTNLQFARTTIRSIGAAGPTVDLARAWFVSGFSILQLADYFCEGTIAASTTDFRHKMPTAELLDSAVNDLEMVKKTAAAITPASTEANNLATAALVGQARALLWLGRKQAASDSAAKVPAAFDYSILHIDNSTQRSLGNRVWMYSESRISLVVGPEFRAMADAGDTRIKYTDMKRLAQDGELQFYRQGKFPGWATNMRFASGLEARYIKEEADQNAVTMLAFINTRRTVGAQGAYAGPTDLTSLMRELLDQKSRDFWLEGKDMEDYRRNPTLYPYVLPAGSTYYKVQFGKVVDNTCWPVPRSETERNPEWNK